ncbi:hypothetical protein TWF281_009299 [Arthrobotrys megalospora]
MKPFITFIILLFPYFLNSSIAEEVRFTVVKRYEHNIDELLETRPPITSTVVFDDVDTSHTVPTNKGGTPTSQESFIEPTDSVSKNAKILSSTDPKPTNSDPDSSADDSPPPLSGSPSNSTSKKPTGKQKSSSSSSSEESFSETTTAFYEKLVKVHINPTPTPNHPTKPTNYPTFANYEQGIVYLNGVPHQVLAADTDYNRLKQAEDGASWEDADKKDDKAKQEELDSELEHQDKLVAGEGGDVGNGHAVYSADLTNAAENAVKKAVFFSVIAAGMITIGLLVFFGTIKG